MTGFIRFKISVVIGLLIFGILSLGTPFVGAQEPECLPEEVYADWVVEFYPGEKANPKFSDPFAAVGPPDLTRSPNASGFVQFGVGGSLTLEFVDNVVVDGPGNDVRFWGDPDNDEGFYVEMSLDGEEYLSFGWVEELGQLDLADIGLESARFIRFIDDTTKEQIEQEIATPGAELDAVEALNCRRPGTTSDVQVEEPSELATQKISFVKDTEIDGGKASFVEHGWSDEPMPKGQDLNSYCSLNLTFEAWIDGEPLALKLSSSSVQSGNPEIELVTCLYRLDFSANHFSRGTHQLKGLWCNFIEGSDYYGCSERTHQLNVY